jgi:glutamate-5-semialdehyde dehydrogenase
MKIIEMAKKAKEASFQLLSISEDQRNQSLLSIAEAIKNSTQEILKENEKDLLEAKKEKLSEPMIDRMKLTHHSLQRLSESVIEIAKSPQVVGLKEEKRQRPNGLIIEKQRIPLGVIGMIFESRPNVVIDGIALAIKSGNAIILKGGKEANHSNKILFEVANRACQNLLPLGSLNLVETRDEVLSLLKLHEYIDLMIPRGGSQLISFVKTHASMPVVAHDKGLCHIYVDSTAKNPIPIILNSKIQRPGVCNAVETLLIHKDYANTKEILQSLIDEKVEIRGCQEATQLHPKVILASHEDYDNEYLDKIISLKIVSSFDEAITHIKKHSSHHTEVILSESSDQIQRFLNELDSSAIVVNASSRFNDGGELGLGAEIGISTSKLHAYGPMGAKEMTTTRFVVTGNGQIRL